MPTHNTYRYTLGVVFDGVGSDTSETGGIAWAYGPAPTGSSNYEWKANHLVRLPESVDTAVNPLSGGFSTSAFDFELSMNDDVATTFLHQSTEPAYKISAAITAGQLTLNITDLAGVAVTSLAASVIWIADECILIGTHVATGTYNVTRDFWGTYGAAHIADSYVHTSVNYWRFRGCKLVVHDRDTATERVLWRGWVGSMGTSEDGTTLAVQCDEVLQSLSNAEVNRGAKNAGLRTPVNMFEHAGDLQISGGKLPRRGNYACKTSSNYVQWYQVDDILTTAAYTTADGHTSFSDSKGEWQSQDAVDVDAFDGSPVSAEDVYEVFAVDSERSALDSSTNQLTYPFHPIEIAMALLTSTRSTTVDVSTSSWDGLGGDWGIGMALDFFDLTQIATLIAETSDVKIGRLLLGWDGEAVNVLDVITETLLKPYGFFVSITTDGKIAFRQLRLFTVTDQDLTNNTVSALPPTLKWDAARSNAVQQVVAEVGELPWRDPNMLSVAGRDGTLTDSLRSALFGEKTTYSLDFSTQVYEEQVRSIAIDRLKYAYYAMPRLTIVAGDEVVTGASYDIGVVITPIIDTNAGWLVKNDATRAAATGAGQVDSQFAGIIVSRTLNLSNMTYRLELLLTNYRQGGALYLRPPAGVVASIDPANKDQVTIEANAFHTSSTDVSKFNQQGGADYVAFWTPDGTLREGGFSISSIISNTVYLDTATTVVVAGDIMRIDEYDAPPSPDNFNRLADSLGTLGAAGDAGRRYA